MDANIVKNEIQASIKVHSLFLNSREQLNLVQEIVDLILGAYKNKCKVFFCGNGGSAADAQHFAAELTGRFGYDRPPLNAEALHVDTSYLTAVANDYSFDEVYARLLQAKAKEGDILVGMSTSGNSKNILKAFSQAEAMGVKTIALTGASGGVLKTMADICISVPSDDTARIQEVHGLVGHIICKLVEDGLFK